MNILDYDLEVQALNKELLTARANMSGSYITICNRLIRKAKEVDDITLLGYSHYFLADAYYMVSTEYRKFNSSLLKAMEYLQMCGEDMYLARCYNLLGIDALSHGNFELSLDFFMSGVKLCNDEQDELSAVYGLLEYNIGQIYYEIGDFKKALPYIRSAYKHIRRDKNDSLYYRNLLFCYCFQADCYMQLGKATSVKNCLLGLKRLEDDPKVNREYFQDIPVLDIRMRGNYLLGNTEEFEKYSDILSKLIQTNKFPLDCVEDIFGICRFFMRIGRVDEVVYIVKNIERSINDMNISYLKKKHARLKCEVYSLIKDEKNKTKALEEYYLYSIAQEKDSLVNYRFFTDIRTKLSAIEQENYKLLKRAETDSLTGLGNRYGLNKYADEAFEKAYSEQKSLAVEILDVDNFKQYNDTYGHQAGDVCLKRIAEAIALKCSSNKNIHAYRYGGDEFVLIYEGMTDEEVMNHAMELRDSVHEMKIESKAQKEGKIVTISQGIRNSVPREATKLWDYMYTADNALYEVKEHKKGEIVMLHKAVISQESLDEAQYS
ncbi:MAG: GGDEF domain-containing protein [Butyrivibrio sp.]|nr:GGDEF domain-containing protein [Butyrivibrio sp.]